MNVRQFFINVNSAYRGSDDDPPSMGTPDYINWINTTNRKISEWARDSKNTWKSLFAIEEIGTLAAGTQEYDLEDNFLQPSDSISITTTAGNVRPYRLCEPQDRDRYYHAAYISGNDPQTLTFCDTILVDNEINGGTILVPGYYLPDPVSKDTDTIVIDDVYWLILAVASELAFNDITYASKTADLNSKANNLYAIMASRNRRGTNTSPRQIRILVDPIRNYR